MQKTEYERRISDWISDVCSSDLVLPAFGESDEFVTVGLLRNDEVTDADRAALWMQMSATTKSPQSCGLFVVRSAARLGLIGHRFGRLLRRFGVTEIAI